MSRHALVRPSGRLGEVMRLRTAVHTLLAIVGTMFLLAAGALGLTTEMLRETGQSLSAHVRALWAIESVQTSLLHHHRLGLALITVPDQRQLVISQRAIEQRLSQDLAELRRLGLQDPEHTELEALALEVDRYLAEWDRLHEAIDDGERVSAMALSLPRERLRAALVVARDHRATFRSEVRAAREALDDVNRAANTIAAAVTVLLAVGAVALVVIFRTKLYVPLIQLRDAIARYGGDQPGVRAPVQGPTEIREIAATFNEVASQLERHRSRELAFLAAVAHDLKNPLSAVSVAAASVRPDRPLPDEARVRRLFSLISRQVERLDRMIGDLLDAARIEAGALELRFEERDLRDMVWDQAELYRHVSPAHEIRVRVPDEPVRARVDPTRFEQVLNNLLSNAIKYSPEGGEVRVSLTREGGRAVLLVEDRGTGIPPEELELIFEPFRRASTTRELIPGVGLGLSVVRRIVRGHGGRIEVESEPGRGSRFRVTLPLERRAWSGEQTGGTAWG